MLKSIGKKMIKDKRGSLVDPIFGGAYILKVALTILIAVFIWFSFQTAMVEVIPGQPSETTLTEVMATLSDIYLSMDYLFPLVVGGLLIVSTIFAYKTGSNIILGFFAILFWSIALLMAALFVNVYLAVSAEFPAMYIQYPIMDLIMINLLWMVLFWVAIITAVMFRKNNVEDDASSKVTGSFYGQ